MAVQLINVGNVANDGTGDDLREAFIKINQNFEELDLRDDEQTTVSNIGAVGEGIFAQKINYDLQFKKLVPGTDITLTSTDNQITIDANGGLKTILVTTDSGSKFLEETDSLNIVGGTGVTTALVGDTLTINNAASEIVTDTTPELGGNLDARTFNITNVGNIDANSVTAGSFTAGSITGNLTGLVYNIDVRDLESTINNYLGFDLGTISQNVTSILDWILLNVDVDAGTIAVPNPTSLNFGSILV